MLNIMTFSNIVWSARFYWMNQNCYGWGIMAEHSQSSLVSTDTHIQKTLWIMPTCFFALFSMKSMDLRCWSRSLAIISWLDSLTRLGFFRVSGKCRLFSRHFSRLSSICVFDWGTLVIFWGKWIFGGFLWTPMTPVNLGRTSAHYCVNHMRKLLITSPILLVKKHPYSVP